MPAGSVVCPSCGAVGPPTGLSACAACGAALTLSGETAAGSAAADEPFTFPSLPQAPDELGRLGPYRVLARLGAGGMGAVFRAEDPQLGRHVALKVMLPRFAASPAAKARFLREARAQAAVEHDHVAAVFQVGEDGGVPYLAMPLLKGETLAEFLRASGRPSVTEAVRIAREAAEGLAAAHATGLIHRDIKPGNLWLEGPRRRVKVLDFGLARPADAAEVEHLTATGAVVGTPAYMSPEQARGEPLDARTDLFSLGAVLYQLLTGRPPFAAPSATGVLIAVATETPPRPSALNREVPPGLDALAMRLLAKRPADRPVSAGAVAAELARFAAPPPPPTGNWTPAPAPKRSRRWLAGAALAVVAAGTAVGGYLLTRPGPGTTAHPAEPLPPVHGGSDAPEMPELVPFTAEQREALAWVTNSKGKVRVLDDRGWRWLAAGDAIPTGPCEVYEIDLTGSPAVDDAAVERLRPVRYPAGSNNRMSLRLGGTKLGPAGLARLASYAGLDPVTDLTLNGSAATDRALAELPGFPNLISLALTKADGLDGSGLVHLRALPRLRYLDLYGSRVLAANLAALRDLELESVGYGDQRSVGDDVLDRLAALPRLRAVMLNGCGLTDSQARKFAGQRLLHYLHLTNNPALTRETAATAAGFRYLHELDLQQTGVDDDGVGLLAAAGELRSLKLTRGRAGAAAVERLSRALPKCEVRYREEVLAKPRAVPPAVSAAHRAALTQPRHGRAWLGCWTAAGMRWAGPAGPPPADDFELWAVHLQWPETTDAALGFLRDIPPITYELMLKDSSVTTEGVRRAVRFPSVAGVRMLYLTNTGVTDALLPDLRLLKALEYLDLVGTKATEPAVKALAAALPGCRIDYPGGTVGGR